MKDVFSPPNKGSPFKRGRSRVYYESDFEKSPNPEVPTSLFNSDTEPLSPVISPTNSVIVSIVSPIQKQTMSAIRKSVTQKFVSSECSPQNCSPVESWRDVESSSLRCSPSQRSQDSGYSDSGESNAGYNPEPSEIPVVKHVTRVYFGEGGSPRTVCNDSSVYKSNKLPQEPKSAPCQRIYRTGKRRCAVPKRYSVQENDLQGNRKLFHNEPSRPTSLHLDENEDVLEHKGLSSEKLLPYKQKTPTKKLSSFLTDWKLFGHDKQSFNHNKTLPVAVRESERTSWTPQFGRCSTPIIDQDESAAMSFSNIPRSPSPIPKKDESNLMPFEIANELQNGALSHWLTELQCIYEPECMNTLQSKSLPISKPQETDLCLTSIQKKAHVVSTQFALLCQKLEDYHLDQVTPVTKSLVNYIQNFMQIHCQRISVNKESQCPVSHQVRVVDQICTRLLEICSESTESPNVSSVSDDFDLDQNLIREIVQVVTALGHAFTKLVDILLCRGVQGIVNDLERSRDTNEALDSVLHLTDLGVNGGHVCRIVGRVGGIKALLNVCIQPSYRDIRTQTLRALATVCCVAEGIAYFEKQGGVEVLSRVLCNMNSTEEEKSEAAGVLAQITSPWVEDNLIFPCLDGHLTQLVTSITELAKETMSSDVFLLASAALANLTFLDSKCVAALLQANTHKVLLDKVQNIPKVTVFIKDQIATVLANLSSTNPSSSAILKANCVPVLVSLLNTRPVSTSTAPEVAASERVQQKSAIAISRLCTDPQTAHQILKMGGANRLAHLCKHENERNYSDAVLVACLAALRKMASSCGHEGLCENTKELVEPRLLDSFLIYSSQQESFV